MKVMIIHPRFVGYHETPRQRWKREHSAKRYERRYGKPREVFKGYLGTFNGMRIIRHTP